MGKQSAGILLYRLQAKEIEVFLVHPGGPFYKNKDMGSWTIPKGEFAEDEDPLAAAKREFLEETGLPISGDFLPLVPIKQKGGKMVYCWAVQGNLDPEKVQSNTFNMEWPPRSGKFNDFPEVDRGAWFSFDLAAKKILPSQAPLLEEIVRLLGK